MDTGSSPLELLRLLQLADSALPVGGMAHSFGLESLVEYEYLNPTNLEAFLHAWLSESGRLETAFCAAACRTKESQRFEEFVELNERLSARKPSREAREGSASMARRLLDLVSRAFDAEWVDECLRIAAECDSELHYGPCFGLAGSMLGIGEEATVGAFLHQTLAALISACQRLMPLGHTQAHAILFRLKPSILKVVAEARKYDLCTPSFAPLIEIASMAHPRLTTRLFIS